MSASDPPKGRALVYRPVDDWPAFAVSTGGGSERGRAAPDPRSTASRLRVGARTRSPDHPHNEHPPSGYRTAEPSDRLLRASRYALDGWPRPSSVAVFRSQARTSEGGKLSFQPGAPTPIPKLPNLALAFGREARRTNAGVEEPAHPKKGAPPSLARWVATARSRRVVSSGSVAVGRVRGPKCA